METVLELQTGERVLNPALDQLCAVICNTDAKYWSYGSGQTGLEYGPGGARTSRIAFTRKDPFGLLVMYWQVGVFKTWVVLSETPVEGVVEIQLGGEPVGIPKGLFVSQETAMAEAAHFVATGEKMPLGPGMKWVVFESMEWGE